MALGKLLRPLIIALALCLSSFGSSQEKSFGPDPASASQADEAALRGLIDKYFAAYAQEDLGAMVRLWNDKSQDLAIRFQEMQQLFTTEDQTLSNLSVAKISIRENRAVLQVTAEVTTVNAETKQSRRERLARSFALIKESGEWKVWRDGPASEDLSAFLDRGGEWKVSLDPAVLDRFAAALVSARTREERDALLADNKQFLTVEMRQVLVRQAARHQAAGNYSALLNDYEVVRTVAEKTGDKEGSAIAEAGLGDAMRNLGRNAQALEHFQNALALYEALGYKLQMAATLDEIGLIYLTQKEYSKAMESYRRVLAFAESFKDKNAIAGAMEEIASVYYEQGSYAEALEFFEKALKLREGPRNKPEIAATLNNIGNAHYQQEDYAVAIEYYQKAIAGFDATGDKQAAAGAMNNIGSAHYSQGNYDTALEFYEKSLKAEEELRDVQGQATSLLGIGLVYYAQGNYGPALEWFQKNLALVESMRDKNRAASALHNIGLVYYHQQNYPLALESYRKSLKLYEGLGDRSEAPIMSGLIGGVYFAQGDYAAAMESYQGALAQFEAIKEADGAAGMLASIASVHYAQGNYSLALESYQKSLAQYEALANKERVAGTLESMAGVYYSQGDYVRSLDFAERASVLAKQDEYLDTLWRARQTAGATYRALNQVQKSQQSFQESIAAIETMRDSLVVGEQARQRFYKDKRFPYVALMELLLAQNKTGEAFAYAERVKVNALADVVQSGGVRITKAMSAVEQGQERRLENRVISLKAQTSREKRRKQPDQKRLASLAEQLQKARADYNAFETRLYAAHPQLKALRGQSQPLKLEEAISLLTTTDAALLEYVVTEGRVYLFVLTHERGAEGGTPLEGRGTGVGERAKVGERAAVSASRPVTSASLTPAPGPRPALTAYALNLSGKDLAERAAKFRDLIARRDESFERGGRELFDLLLKPASEQLDDRQSWTIVPDSLLWQIPFQALQPADARYLVESHAISYAPSLTALLEMRKLRDARAATAKLAAPAKLLAFANPLISKQRAERIKLANADEELAPSPEMENEVRALRQLYPAAESEIYLGAEAREENAKQRATDFKALHFAAPATLNDVSPMYSHIALADSPENAREDGLLEAWEIMRLSLRAELAILSASETSGGRVKSGNGLMCMTWALFIAGCPTTIVSEWKADSPFNTELMLELHRRLRFAKGAHANQQPQMSKAQALQQATLKLMQNSQYSHPFYWARFAVVGDGR